MTKAKILIVDDRPENLLTLESLLDNPDVDVIRANSGGEALAKTLDHDFALVLLDVQMPDMDGYEVAELMRGNKNTRNIPIIFVTAKVDNMNQVFRGYESGAVDYLFKPLDAKVFQSKVGIFLDLFRQKAQLEQKTRELDAKVVELEELQQILEETNEQLRLLSAMDGLTGLLNRRRFDEILQEEWQRCLRDGCPLSLLLVDIDHFKAYNDSYGHLMGDNCLKKVSGMLANSLQRHVDKVARYGGEEFTIVLPSTDEEGAMQVAERMRANVEELGIEHCDSDTCGNVTISVGVGSVMPKADGSSHNLLDQADKALYKAKKEGRNRCCTIRHC
ncbi:GGDEF domain-containing response regulator [Pseudodesulfovibrio piezophilus]|uniref:diguanylate cyclase n=1 Tax=Pseudodesulfovibrio piezophilus (strain DSM 21447 / JCM 15486 / C1TLV30) TaxID=1322246 RepID=M1WTW3_PSEP2|nr:diguanylate cyclase [Pseudodesulfovibrio piezophilus]CCH49952.1 Related to two-component system response regulator (Hybrid family) [Pseudodesulfovibrio piezophilus C1TLV30]